MVNNLIQNKYVIKKKNDIIGSKKNVEYIEDWLENSMKDKQQIKECIDLDTGELITDVQKFIADFYGKKIKS
jgi:tetrahydromethanopterin S-methyltransferase subunit A